MERRATLLLEVDVRYFDDLDDDGETWEPEFDVVADVLRWYLQNMANVLEVRCAGATLPGGDDVVCVLPPMVEEDASG